MKNFDPKYLQQFSLFAGLSSDGLEKVRKIMTIRTVTEGSYIIKENEKGNEMFLLLEGEVEVSRSLMLKIEGSGLNQRDKLLNKLSAKDFPFFGEMGLFDENSERSASVIVTTKCTVGVLQQESFFKLIEKDKEIGFILLKNILKIISDRLDKTTKDVLKLTTALSLALER